MKPSASQSLRAGYGQYHHREGYNVLYGDWHGAWFADPDQRIMWTVQAPSTTGAPIVPDANAPFSYCSQRNGSAGGNQVCSVTTASTAHAASGRQTVYHMFDELAGIDVGAPPLP